MNGVLERSAEWCGQLPAYMAHVDIKGLLDDARPDHIGNAIAARSVHPMLIAAVLHELIGNRKDGVVRWSQRDVLIKQVHAARATRILLMLDDIVIISARPAPRTMAGKQAMERGPVMCLNIVVWADNMWMIGPTAESIDFYGS